MSEIEELFNMICIETKLTSVISLNVNVYVRVFLKLLLTNFKNKITSD